MDLTQTLMNKKMRLFSALSFVLARTHFDPAGLYKILRYLYSIIFKEFYFKIVKLYSRFPIVLFIVILIF